MSPLIVAFFSVLAAQCMCFTYAAIIGQVHSLQEIAGHLLVPSGPPFVGAYIVVHWYAGMHASYKNEEMFRPQYVIYQLLVVDAFMTLAHFLVHRKLFGGPFYQISHAPHHTHTPPKMIDAFDGSFADTALIIIAPLFITSQIVHASTYEYMLFGVLWSSMLTLIHSPTNHFWERTFFWRICFLATASDHRNHHLHPSRNMGHIFNIWDRILELSKRLLEEKVAKYDADKRFPSLRAHETVSRKYRGDGGGGEDTSASKIFEYR